ncbi:hypothetical protein NYO91_09465 [Arhodomonas aquaeolei]|uniref:hypothetical protein n=1 Tax=Arhodomonas aquaeolei TaxID=2369 RepID=UPI0021678905|nr:hypothetical protein [Arhodomonas aquaeolei]MCS4504303.1 hypothetical protein [Arhodomonas aquaeolei]
MLYLVNQEGTETGYLERRNAVRLHSLNFRENDLQRWLTHRLDRVIRTDDLLPITQSRMGEEMPDILALDRDGRLFIFELKRWESESSNLLQVMRYAQIASAWGYEKLNALYQREHEDNAELGDAHRDHFGYVETLSAAD